MSGEMRQVAESGAGKLYEANTFVVPVLTGTAHEMGVQYGALMADHMQQAWDVLVEPGRTSGAITDDRRPIRTVRTRWRSSWRWQI